jgi:hypothetical protein
MGLRKLYHMFAYQAQGEPCTRVTSRLVCGLGLTCEVSEKPCMLASCRVQCSRTMFVPYQEA